MATKINTTEEIIQAISDELATWDGESIAEIACQVLYKNKVRYLGNEEFETEEPAVVKEEQRECFPGCARFFNPDELCDCDDD